MAKCFICKQESNVVITIEAYNHKEHICGKCALDKEIITDHDVRELIRRAVYEPNKGKHKSCANCKELVKKNRHNQTYFHVHDMLFSEESSNYICKRFGVGVDKKSVRHNYCECHEFKQ